MYKLPYYSEQDPQAVRAFMQIHPFAFLAGCDAAGGPVATQVPVFVEDREDGLYLNGHLMRNTDHHKAFEQIRAVLCVFTGPHTYVSATWYSNPHQASTWNYMSVHATGKISFMNDEGLADMLQKTSLHFEDYDLESTTVYSNLDKAYTSRLLKALVGFEIKVESLDTVFKLSQEKDAMSRRSIIQQLTKGDAAAQGIAVEMQRREAASF